MSEASPFGKILGINLLVLLVYAIGLKVYAAATGADEAFVVLMAFVLAVHVAVDLVMALALGLAGKRDAALGFLASAPLVLLVGFGACLGGSAIRLDGGSSR
jgi:hypothetical protein